MIKGGRNSDVLIVEDSTRIINASVSLVTATWKGEYVYHASGMYYHMQLSKHPNISNEEHLTIGLGRL